MSRIDDAFTEINHHAEVIKELQGMVLSQQEIISSLVLAIHSTDRALKDKLVKGLHLAKGQSANKYAAFLLEVIDELENGKRPRDLKSIPHLKLVQGDD